VKFLKENSVYAMMPTSSKVLVLDVEVPLRLAFFALVENSASSAPIWDREMGVHVGLLSPSEFLTVLLYFYQSRTISKNLLSHSLRTWLNQRGEAVSALRKTYQDRDLMPPPTSPLQFGVSSRTFPPNRSSPRDRTTQRSPTIQIPSTTITTTSTTTTTSTGLHNVALPTPTPSSCTYICVCVYLIRTYLTRIHS